MNTAWINFLHAQSPAVAEFNPENTGWLALSNRASIRVSGSDAADFLQAMLTQEILALTPSHAARGALCNAKGRMLTTLLIHPKHTEQGSEYHLTVPQDLRVDLLKTLKLYVLRRRVMLELVEDWGFIGILNPHHTLLLAVGIDAEPAETLAQPQLNNGLIATWEHHAATPRLSLQGPLSALMAVGQQIASPRNVWVAPAVWDCAEIQDGIPEIHPDTCLHFVPQWVNLDFLNAVSFNKGCYPGQEIIARLHYLGKSNRRMIMGRITHSAPLQPGTLIHVQNTPDIEAGEIVRSAPCESGNESDQLFLAVIRLNHAHDALTVAQHPCVLYPSPFVETDPVQTH
ncbi:MAG: CAF17-like 4Fe-4S cluster assembly/insertion protein YgfZ [Halothiobacillus sp.]